jgi:hypothetical protein
MRFSGWPSWVTKLGVINKNPIRADGMANGALKVQKVIVMFELQNFD